MKESVVEASTHEIIHDKKHEIIQEGISEDIQTSMHDIFVYFRYHNWESTTEESVVIDTESIWDFVATAKF